MTVVDVLERSEARPDDPALVGSGVTWSYADLDERVGARWNGFRSAGAGQDRLFPLPVEPTPEGIVDLLALWRMGAVPVPLNPRSTEAERVSASEELAESDPPEGTQVVLWTSGTSGRPRGVALSWENLEASARAAADRLGLGASDVWLASLSPAHVGGLATITRSILLGGVLVTPGSHDTARLSDLLDGSDAAAESGRPPTHVSLVPTQLLRLLDHRGDRPAPLGLRCALIGGAHAPASLVERAIDAGWPVALTYGATEMSSQIATAPPEVVRAAPGTVGRPLAGVEVHVGEDGELRARGATRALGYVGRGAGPLADDEGWYRTGDLGRIDGEGLLWITGRRIDRIVSGGVTIDAVEVEEELRAHPTVIDACVVGVPDEEWGERVGAWVEPVEGELDLEELDRHLRERLSAAKLPRIWHVAAAIPRNANGKVDRAAVRDVLGRGRVPPSRGG